MGRTERTGRGKNDGLSEDIGVCRDYGRVCFAAQTFGGGVPRGISACAKKYGVWLDPDNDLKELGFLTGQAKKEWKNWKKHRE